MSFSQRSESVQTATLVVVLEKLNKAYFCKQKRTERIHDFTAHQKNNDAAHAVCIWVFMAKATDRSAF